MSNFFENLGRKIEYLSEGRPSMRFLGFDSEKYQFRNLSPIIQAFIAPMFLLSGTF